MTIYARVVNGIVAEPPLGLPPHVTIADCFHPDIAATWVDCSAVPNAAQGWAYDGTTFTPPPLVVLSLDEQARRALRGALTISLSGSMTLAPTLFPVDETTTMKIAAVITTLIASGSFPGGLTSFPMRDAASPPQWHSFTSSQYRAVATAISAYVAGLHLIADGNPFGAVSLPPSSVSLVV